MYSNYNTYNYAKIYFGQNDRDASTKFYLVLRRASRVK